MGAQLRDTVTTAPARLLPLSLEASVAVLLYQAQEKTKETMTRNKRNSCQLNVCLWLQHVDKAKTLEVFALSRLTWKAVIATTAIHLYLKLKQNSLH